MKTIISLIIGLAIVIVIAFIAVKCKPDRPSVGDIIDVPDTEIVIPSIPAKHKVVPPPKPGTPDHEIAYMDTTISSSDKLVNVDLGIEYNKTVDTFGIDARIRQSYVKPKPKLFGLVGGVGIGFRDSLQLHDAELSAGVEFAEKYSVSVFGRSDLTYGLRFGVRF